MEVFPHFDAKIYRVLRFEMGLTNHHMCGIRGYVRFGDMRFGRFEGLGIGGLDARTLRRHL